MTKDVLVSVEGLQFNGDPEATRVEIITAGSYYKKKNHHFVLYDEVSENRDEITKNIIRFDNDMLELTKRGYTNVAMVFEENKRNMTNYITPFGSLLIGIDANKIDIVEKEDEINISIDYALDVNYEHLSDCKIRMDIKSKSENAISLI